MPIQVVLKSSSIGCFPNLYMEKTVVGEYASGLMTREAPTWDTLSSIVNMLLRDVYTSWSVGLERSCRDLEVLYGE